MVVYRMLENGSLRASSFDGNFGMQVLQEEISRTFYSSVRFNSAPLLLYSYEKRAKLWQVESRSGMSRSEIIKILSERGYHIPDKSNYSLTYDHLLILADEFEKSVRKLFKQTKKKYRKSPQDSIDENFIFFSSFIRDKHKIGFYGIYNQELDSDLIQDWFIEKVTAVFEEDKLSDSFSFLLGKLKFRLKKLYRDIRFQIFSIILSHHYHVFPSEEDGSEKLDTTKSFSDFWISWKRKAKIKFNIIKAFKHDTNKYFNSAYTTMQPI